MFNIVLYQPEIPPNTGNIMRLCANTGSKLHLIEPLGFSLGTKELRRAGLDYISRSSFITYKDFSSFIKTIDTSRMFLCSTKVKQVYSTVEYLPGDALVFGPESRGLPIDILDSTSFENKITIPMHPDGRSLNLATAVSIILFEAWRQHDFAIIP